MPTPVTSAFGTCATEYAYDAPRPQIARNLLIYSSGIQSAPSDFAQGNAERVKELERISLQNCNLEQLVDVSAFPKLKYLDLSGNKQWQWPNLSNNPELIFLNCGKNAYNLVVENGEEGQLIGIPLDLSGTSKLEELYLYFNRLEQDQMPDLSPLPQLRILGLSGNRLTKQPNILSNTKLEQIFLNDNKLNRGLDFCPLTELQILEVKNNRLIEQPDLTGLAKLKRIDLSGNKLTRLVEFSTNTDLEEIILNHNKLGIPPIVLQNNKLTLLALQGNELIRSPDVSNKPKLLSLNLRDNLLENLNDSTFNLPSVCTVYAEGNKFSDAYIQKVKETLDKIRIKDPDCGPIILFK